MIIKKRSIKKRNIKKRSIKKRSIKKRSIKKRSSKKKSIKKKYDAGKIDKIDKIDKEDDYLKNWKKIDNKGQNNCGIFINSENNRILKCESFHIKSEELSNLDLDLIISQKYSIINSFLESGGEKLSPKIYYVKYILNGLKIHIYTEMEKLDGDITSYFLDKISESVIKEDAVIKEFDADIKNDIIYIFNLQQNSTSGNKINSYDLKKIKDYEKIETLDAVADIKNKDDIIKLYEQLNNTKLTEEIYCKFISAYSLKLQKKLKEINKKLKELDKELKEIGFSYHDRKFDNFGYKIKDDKDKDDIDIYVLDWTSGLRDDVEYNDRYLLKSYSINGQYNLYNLLRKINATNDYDMKERKPFEIEFNCNFLNTEINKIFKTKYELIPKDFDWNVIDEFEDL